MSAPMVLTADQLRRLAAWLDAASESTRDTGVRADAYGPVDLILDDVRLQATWSAQHEAYVVDDRVGS